MRVLGIETTCDETAAAVVQLQPGGSPLDPATWEGQIALWACQCNRAQQSRPIPIDSPRQRRRSA
jgi:tRNA A37 threonylcarbamoyltransferase TsaD